MATNRSVKLDKLEEVTTADFAEKDNNFSGVQRRGTHIPLSRSEREAVSLSRRHLMGWPSKKTYPRYKV